MATVKFNNANVIGNIIYDGFVLAPIPYNIQNANSVSYTVTGIINGELSIVLCNTSPTGLNAPATIILPAITSNCTIIIVYANSNYANINNITIQTSGANTVCGTNSILLDGNFNSLRFTSDLSSSWLIL